MVQLRNGFTVDDERLDRLPQFDVRSRNFPIRSLLPDKKPRSYTWACDAWLDQGSEGACVGFSWAHEAAARPVVRTSTSALAIAVYKRAQELDEWEGTEYSGTSVLAGAKAMQEQGFLGEYRWAFGLDDLVDAVGHHGPAILGINWYEAMFDANDLGMIYVQGDIAGGHAILCNGVSVSRRVFRLHNSWGRDWARSGEAYISFSDMERLLHEQGEACIPVQRKR